MGEKTLSKGDNHPRGHVKMTMCWHPYKLVMVEIKNMKDGLWARWGNMIVGVFVDSLQPYHLYYNGRCGHANGTQRNSKHVGGFFYLIWWWQEIAKNEGQPYVEVGFFKRLLTSQLSWLTKTHVYSDSRMRNFVQFMIRS